MNYEIFLKFFTPQIEFIFENLEYNNPLCLAAAFVVAEVLQLDFWLDFDQACRFPSSSVVGFAV